ncbi:MAG: carbon-nitrogen family hydrolase [Dethiobacteria bacterium]
MYKAVLIQLDLSDNETRSDRFEQVEEYLKKIAESDDIPLIVILPEIWATGFFNFDRYHKESEHLQGETYSRLAPWAEKIGCYILGGSIIEQDGTDYYNTSILINPNGSLAGCYRKIHLFGYQSEESELLNPGSDLYIMKSSYGTWGFSTCYDLRFPELYRKLISAGVDTLFVIAAWPKARLEHWILLNCTRALENLCNLIACNCAGSLRGTALGGNSLVIDPWGNIIAQGGESGELLIAEIDPGLPAAVRAKFPALSDRRL